MCHAIVAERLHGVFECHNAKKSGNPLLMCFLLHAKQMKTKKAKNESALNELAVFKPAG
jgi:hypothetical protein